MSARPAVPARELTRGHRPADAGGREVSYVDWHGEDITATFMDGNTATYPAAADVPVLPGGLR